MWQGPPVRDHQKVATRTLRLGLLQTAVVRVAVGAREGDAFGCFYGPRQPCSGQLKMPAETLWRSFLPQDERRTPGGGQAKARTEGGRREIRETGSRKGGVAAPASQWPPIRAPSRTGCRAGVQEHGGAPELARRRPRRQSPGVLWGASGALRPRAAVIGPAHGWARLAAAHGVGTRGCQSDGAAGDRPLGR